MTFTVWTASESNPGGGEIFRTRPNRLWEQPSPYTTGAGSLSQK